MFWEGNPFFSYENTMQTFRVPFLLFFLNEQTREKLGTQLEQKFFCKRQRTEFN